MTTPQTASDRRTTSAREQIVAEAAAMGIDRDYISTLVETFYSRVQKHDLLGPIFNDAISDWDAHLKTMKRFWASVALNAGEYSGKPVPAHRKHIDMIKAADFDVWLGLFRQTLDETAPTPAARDYFMVRAERIAKSLRLAMFGTPTLGPPRYA